MRVIDGEIFDVAADLRGVHQTFGRWHTEILLGEHWHLLWIPHGSAHGFRVLSRGLHVVYKATDYYRSECERALM